MANPGFAAARPGYVGRDMTNQQTLTQLPDHPRPDPPMPHAPPRGFLDCRGEWQALDEDEDRHAPS
jgi:hypothetical protein